jgi:alkylhydroperoxidase/carboxymuconolactone decarboxylase family protein YurZ
VRRSGWRVGQPIAFPYPGTRGLARRRFIDDADPRIPRRRNAKWPETSSPLRTAATAGSASGAFFWEAVDPQWHELFGAYVHQGMYQRRVLDQKTRELCAVAALTVLNQQGALGRHLLSALDYGATFDEVLEVVLQMSVYGGFPATQAALETFRTQLAEVGEAPPKRS